MTRLEPAVAASASSCEDEQRGSRLAAKNGRAALDHALNVAMRDEDLAARSSESPSTFRCATSSDRVLHQVRDIEWSLQDVDSLHDVLLHLKIELDRDDS